MLSSVLLGANAKRARACGVAARAQRQRVHGAQRQRVHGAQAEGYMMRGGRVSLQGRVGTGEGAELRWRRETRAVRCLRWRRVRAARCHKFLGWGVVNEWGPVTKSCLPRV